MTTPKSLIGGTVSIVAAVPATEDQAGYGALTFVEIAEAQRVPETGNTSESGTSPGSLKTGVKKQFNGSQSVSPFTIPYAYLGTDAGQNLVRANANGSTTCSLKVTDQDGDAHYIFGVVGPVMDSEKTPDAYKAQTFEFRPQSLWTKV